MYGCLVNQSREGHTDASMGRHAEKISTGKANGATPGNDAGGTPANEDAESAPGKETGRDLEGEHQIK
jgi:hypothetical protein